MKRKLKNFISFALFLVLLVGAIMGCADLFEYKEARIKYTPFFESKTNFDVIFMGTSHMHNSILPMELWNEYGIASYNWGYSNCTPAETYYLLQEVVKYTSPKVIVLDLYGLVEYKSYKNGKYRDDRIEQQHVQFDSLPLSLNKIVGTQDIFDNYAHNYDFLWNFAMYHNRWEELGQKDFDYSYTTEKGALFLTGYGSFQFEPKTFEETYLPDTVCYDYFLKTLEYCEENGIPLVCTYTPFAAGETNQKIAQSIGSVIEQYEGCHYVDMLYQDIVDFSTDMYKDGHLNYSGACKATSWIGEYLIRNYRLSDYSGNEYWQKDYQDYLEYKIQNLKNQTTLVNHLLLLYGDDFVCNLEVYDETLADAALLWQLADNVAVPAEVVPLDSNYSAKLTVTSAATGDIIVERYFSYDRNKTFNIQNVTVAEK